MLKFSRHTSDAGTETSHSIDLVSQFSFNSSVLLSYTCFLVFISKTALTAGFLVQAFIQTDVLSSCCRLHKYQLGCSVRTRMTVSRCVTVAIDLSLKIFAFIVEASMSLYLQLEPT